jgi:hypothetical protein
MAGHVWFVRVETNVEDLGLSTEGVKGYISQYWKCKRCGAEFRGGRWPHPNTKVPIPIIGPWSGKPYSTNKYLTCDEYLVSKIMES